VDVDRVAEALARWGRAARALPQGPLFHDAQPLVCNGQRLGRILPGRGVLLDADLHKLGIHKPIPNVLERTPWARLAEFMADDRGTVTSLSDLLAGQNRQIFTISDQFRAAVARYVGQQFDAIASAVTFTNFTTGSGILTGALNRTFCAGSYTATIPDPPAGKKKYLLGLSMLYSTGAGTGFGMGMLVDILSVIGNLDATSTAAQTFSSAALTRFTSGIGVYYAVCGSNNSGSTPSTTVTATIGYTNAAGTSGRSANFVYDDIVGSALLAIWDGTIENNLLAHPLQAGDSGVQSIQSLTLSSGNGITAGTKLGILIYKPLYFMHSIADNNTMVERDMRAEPECVVELPVDGGGVLGYHSLLWCNGTGTTTTTNTFTGVVCEA